MNGRKVEAEGDRAAFGSAPPLDGQARARQAYSLRADWPDAEALQSQAG